MIAGRGRQFSGEDIGADECETRALAGHGRGAIGSISQKDHAPLRPSWHLDLSGLIKVPIRRRWHHLQQPGNFPADSLIDCFERLLLLNPVVQTNVKRLGRKAKTGLGIRITAGTPNGSNSTDLGVLNLHAV